MISNLLANSQTDEDLDKIKPHYWEMEEKTISTSVKYCLANIRLFP